MSLKKSLPLIWFMFLALLFSLALALLSAGAGQPSYAQDSTPAVTEEPVPTEPPFFDGQAAYEFAALQVGFGFRPTGSTALRQTGDAIIEILEAAGWEVITQEFDHVVGNEVFPVRNIIARRGEGPITIVASHYDTRLIADQDPDSERQDEPVMGANDAASSASVVLELAETISEYYDVNEQVWLVFFDAEDNGRIPGWDWIIGSTYMAENLQDLGVEPEDFRLMILLDMVGEADTDREYVGFNMQTEKVGQRFYYENNSLTSAPEHVEGIWQLAVELGYADQFAPEPRYTILDDHLPFIARGIPAVDIIDFDYPYWHTTQDTLDKLSAESLGRIGQVVEMYLLQLDALQVKPQ